MTHETQSHPPESNRRPTDYESVALPTELGWRAALLAYLAVSVNGWRTAGQPIRSSRARLAVGAIAGRGPGRVRHRHVLAPIGGVLLLGRPVTVNACRRFSESATF